MVTLNCAGLTETLLESELFGHVKGSFTGAYRDKPGKLAAGRWRHVVPRRSRGDEPADAGAPAAFPRERRGAARRRRRARSAASTSRIVAATNRNLADRVAAGEFREDLLYRLRVIHIHVPPLRERRDDIRPLLEHLREPSSHGRCDFTTRRCQLLAALPVARQRPRTPEHRRAGVWQSGSTDRARASSGAHTRGRRFCCTTRERRRQVADDLYEALAAGHYSFWAHIHPLFLSRDITRHDIRELVRRGLQETRGSYRGLVALFNMQPHDYQRFHNFLTAHGCKVEFREFRNGDTPQAPPRRVLDPLAGAGGGARHGRDTCA